MTLQDWRELKCSTTSPVSKGDGIWGVLFWCSFLPKRKTSPPVSMDLAPQSCPCHIPMVTLREGWRCCCNTGCQISLWIWPGINPSSFIGGIRSQCALNLHPMHHSVAPRCSYWHPHRGECKVERADPAMPLLSWLSLSTSRQTWGRWLLG